MVLVQLQTLEACLLWFYCVLTNIWWHHAVVGGPLQCFNLAVKYLIKTNLHSITWNWEVNIDIVRVTETGKC